MPHAHSSTPIHAPHNAGHKAWRVKITMPDGSSGRHYGWYADGCAAVVRALDLFPAARGISARCLGSTPDRPMAVAIDADPGAHLEALVELTLRTTTITTTTTLKG